MVVIHEYTQEELNAGEVPHLDKSFDWHAKLGVRIPALKAARHPEMLEGQLLKEVTMMLDRRGLPWVRIDGSPKIIGSGASRTQIPSSHAGTADLLIFPKNGLAAFVELKAPKGGDLSTNQVRMHHKYSDGQVPHWVSQSVEGVELGISLCNSFAKDLWRRKILLINSVVHERHAKTWVEIVCDKVT